MLTNKLFLLAATAAVISVSVLAQQPSPPPGTISRPSPYGATNQIGTSTNTVSTDQLAAQLQDVRSTVEQTLPTLTSFLETVTNSTSSGGRTIVGTVTEILSGVLNRNAGQNPAGSSAQATNVAGVLQGLLNTNAPTSANATVLKDLATLQTELQSIRATLARLNVASTNFGTGLTPTGR